MHDAEFRLNAFIDEMKIKKPDFIVELGDFAEAQDSLYYKIWNSFPGQKYHVIGNHEMDGGHSLEEALRSRDMKISYYSFEKNGFHFIVLDGNDKKSESVKGYRQFIGEKQLEWFINDLSQSIYPVIVFSHQGLLNQQGAEEMYGVENADQLRKIVEDHNAKNPASKVIACFNGHTHWDYAEKINDVWYVTINSMSYNWLGESYAEIRYSEEVDRNFKWIKFTAPFRDPLYTIVEISREGWIKIAGKKTEWVGSSPFALGYPERMKEFIRPAITERTLRF
jgi:predicted phosphodiesterase